MSTKIFKLKSKYVNRKAQLKLGKYATNAVAVQVVAPIPEGVDQSEIIATVSVHTELSEALPSNQFFGKNYSENEGILESIEDAGLIKLIKKEGTKSGYVTLPIYELKLNNIKERSSK